MALVAPASTTVRNKNLILVAMFAVFAIWFSYDGWKGYPAGNDKVIAKRLAQVETEPGREPAYYKELQEWPGWSKATAAQRKHMSESLKIHTHDEGWKSSNDIILQQGLALVLYASTLGFVGWFWHCQRRRAVADEAGLSPAPGVLIPWTAITKIDNRRWRKVGIVTVEYKDAAGQVQTAELDDYLLDHDQLLPILEKLGEEGEKHGAEFLNPPEDTPGEPAAKT